MKRHQPYNLEETSSKILVREMHTPQKPLAEKQG